MKIVDKVKSNQKLMRFIETTQNRITDSEMGTTSVVVAYYLLLSLFPLMIALGIFCLIYQLTRTRFYLMYRN